MPFQLDEIISLHQFEFREVVVSPDDRYVLCVFGNYDVPPAQYQVDVMKRSIWKTSLHHPGHCTQLVSSNEDGHYPRWSPDGRKIAYLSYRSGQTELWVMSGDGTGKTQLTHSSFSGVDPFNQSQIIWTPDSKRIVYTVLPNGTGRGPGFYDAWNDMERNGSITVEREPWESVQRLAAELRIPAHCVLCMIDVQSTESQQIAVRNSNSVKILGWVGNAEQLLIRVGNQLESIDVKTHESKQILSGHAVTNLVKVDGSEIRLAYVEDSVLMVGHISNCTYVEECRMEPPGYHPVLHDWSVGGKTLFISVEQGVSTVLYEIDIMQRAVRQVTQSGKCVVRSSGSSSVVKCLHLEHSVVFPYSDPNEPTEFWKYADDSLVKLTGYVRLDKTDQHPTAKIVTYKSGEWDIEAILVLPTNYVAGHKYPTLFFAHGGPDYVRCEASFAEVISSRGQSVAYYLASHGYVVLLPNFRGSDAYGTEFKQELGSYNLLRHPFLDVMTGCDYLVNEGLADPNALGLYGHSFGGWLTAWAVSQTNRFRGAISIVAGYDPLNEDRTTGRSFLAHPQYPHRLGTADPKDMWNNPQLYTEISPIEHVHDVKTPLMLIETYGERRNRASLARPLFNGLRAAGVESYLVYYPEAYHSGGWNDEYKRDYMKRTLAWFDHCLQGVPLPDWFYPS